MQKIDEDSETITIELSNMEELFKLYTDHNQKGVINFEDRFIVMFRKKEFSETEKRIAGLRI